MHYYLARYVGAGTDVTDSFRPANDDAPTWSAIDLRPDPATTTGRGLLAVPGDQLPTSTNRVYLGNDLDAPSNAVKTNIESRLGVTLDSTDLRHIIAELLIIHARGDGTRWRPLVASGRRLRIWLGELIYDVPVIAGGSVYTDDMNKADSAVVGATLTFTDIVGDIQNVSNRAEVVVSAVTARSRAEHDTATVNQYAETVVSAANPGSGTSSLGPCLRYAAGADTCYQLTDTRTSGPVDALEIRKVVTGTSTILSSAAITLGSGDTLRHEANGSSLVGKQNGTTQTSITDTAITTGTRGGIQVRAATNAVRTTTYIDSFTFGDLATAASLVHDDRRVRRNSLLRR